jgi:spermidine/putrescine-binding protein
MWDSYFDAYIAAAVMSGKGPSVEEGIKLWAPHKQNIGAWTTSPTKVEDDVARGEMWLAPHWGSWCEQAKSQGKKLAFTIPREGAVQWAGHMVAVTGFSPKVTELTLRYLDTWNSEECQIGWVTRGFFGPANRKVKLPADLARLEAVMTAEEAAKRLIRYDVKAVGEKIPKLKAMIDQTLKV